MRAERVALLYSNPVEGPARKGGDGFGSANGKPVCLAHCRGCRRRYRGGFGEPYHGLVRGWCRRVVLHRILRRTGLGAARRISCCFAPLLAALTACHHEEPQAWRGA